MSTDAHGAEPAFCCRGCAAAYQIIRGLGFDRYYDMRRQASGQAGLRPETDQSVIDLAAYARPSSTGGFAVDLVVDGLSCAACVWLIESILKRQPGLSTGRVSLGSRRLRLEWSGPIEDGRRFVGAVEQLGYRLVPYDPECLKAARDNAGNRLLKSLAVAGFASANVMLFSVSLWSGVEMGPVTRDLLHWFSALIALPAIAYAGQPFFGSAWRAIRNGGINMDVPIALGVLLVSLMSVVETVKGAQHTYFDGAVMLLFFLLIGRFLDHRARGNARSAVESLLALRSRAVMLIAPDGGVRACRPEAVDPGQRIMVAAGERIGVDGVVVSGQSEIDVSLVTGESAPVEAKAGVKVFAGTINLNQPLVIQATAVGEGTLLAEIARLMQAAESRRGRFVALADRVARFYAPAVHILAAATFLLWWLGFGARWETALINAVAVLIVTCPCALGLAIPAVQVIASGRLMRRGILIRNPTALDRLSEIDTVVFDKTGTLTEGKPTLLVEAIGERSLIAAASIGQASRHPLAVALVAAARQRGFVLEPSDPAVREIPGQGLIRGQQRLGSREFCGIQCSEDSPGPELWFSEPGRASVRFSFSDRLRPDAGEVIASLSGRKLAVALRSGDRTAPVRDVAARVGIEDWAGRCSPVDKVSCLEGLRDGGRKVLMVGDGLNDAPALAAADVSMSPASAADISQTAADIVFQGTRLDPVIEAIDCARKARRVARENIALAIAYNVIVVPLAIAGMVTPLIAAAAMSSSSIIVVLNSFRVRKGRG